MHFSDTSAPTRSTNKVQLAKRFSVDLVGKSTTLTSTIHNPKGRFGGCLPHLIPLTQIKIKIIIQFWKAPLTLTGSLIPIPIFSLEKSAWSAKKLSITNLNLSDKLISFFLCEVQSAAPSCSFFNRNKIVNTAYRAKGIERSWSNQPWLKSDVAHLLTDYSSHLPTAAI